MVSACINNVGILPESLLDLPSYQPSHDWLSPRLSFSRDLTSEDLRNVVEKVDRDDSLIDYTDFEFRLSDPVTMLSADELFSNGKLIPLHLTPIRPAAEPHAEISNKSRDSFPKKEICRPDHHQCGVTSPKAPKCSSRWKEILGLKKSQNRETVEGVIIKIDNHKISDHRSDYTKPFPKHHRKLRFSSNDSSANPLLRDCSDSESVSISARISLSSSSSSGGDHDDLPRFSLDLDRINSSHPPLPPRHKVGKPKHTSTITTSSRPTLELLVDGNIGSGPIKSTGENNSGWRTRVTDSGDLPPPMGVSVDSPRLNASGKVIFQGLGRSSSSPSFLNAGTRPRPVLRSYSGNVRVKPVLNVPVCNLRGTAKSVSAFGLGQLFVPQKRNSSKV